MKKLFILLLIVVVLAGASAYVFVPEKIKIAAVAKSAMNMEVAYRYLAKPGTWPKWWPGEKVFHYNGIDFRIDKIMLNSFEMQLFYKKDSMTNTLQIIPLNNDSIAYRWNCEMKASNNPIKRWMQYLNAIQIKKTLSALTDSLKEHLENEENVYGFRVQNTKVVDSVLISTRSAFDHYPEAEEIGQMVQKVKDYIEKEKAVGKNYPMLHVHQLGTNDYEAIVAIATDRKLPATKDFAPKLVLKGGNILEAEFTGGPAGIKKAFQEFENYKVDRGFVSPAIPYQLMVTDRLKEKDTAKWVTRFYYPIF